MRLRSALRRAMALLSLDYAAAVEAERHRVHPWHRSGPTYFVTLRLSDALPVQALYRLGEVKSLDSTKAFTWLDGQLDAGRGGSLLADRANSLLIETALTESDLGRYSLGPYVIMPNHVHVLVQPRADCPLAAVIHRWKARTARKLQQSSPIRGRVWHEESFERTVRDEAELRRLNDYIFANPTRAAVSSGSFRFGCGSAEWPT